MVSLVRWLKRRLGILAEPDRRFESMYPTVKQLVSPSYPQLALLSYSFCGRRTDGIGYIVLHIIHGYCPDRKQDILDLAKRMDDSKHEC